MFDFILSKTQHASFIASWKEAHATKQPIYASSYLLRAILVSAAPDIKAKATKAFSPCKYKTPSYASYELHLNNLLYYAKRRSYPFLNELELSEEQWDRLIAILEELKADLKGA